MDEEINRIADHYGFTSQADMLCEETAEYITARNKIRRGVFESAHNFKEELADVLLVALQLRHIIGADSVDNIIKQKIERQLERMRKERSFVNYDPDEWYV